MLRLPRRFSSTTAKANVFLRQRIPGHGWKALTSFDKSEASSTPLWSSEAWLETAWRSVSVGFLPRGYPHSVADRYLPYVGWTAASLLTGRIQSVLATQAALFTVGLGAGSIPMAAAVQWVLKDGVGNVGAIVYAASVNTRFDADAKRYRFQSTCALTFADFIAVLMPLVPQHFFIMASLSSTTSSIANLAHVAARARIMASFALKDNLADCVRAGQTQGKLMSVVGTGVGAGLSWVIGPDPLHVAGALFPLAAISIYSTHVSSQLVVLRTLNVQRAELVLDPLSDAVERRWSCDGPQTEDSAPWPASLEALTPEYVASQETFVMPYASPIPGELLLQPLFTRRVLAEELGSLRGSDGGGADLRLALRALAAAAGATDPHTKSASTDGDGDERAGSAWIASWCDSYAIAVCARDGHEGARVALWHVGDASAESKLKAFWHASMLRRRLSSRAASSLGSSGQTLCPRSEIASALELVHTSWDEVRSAITRAGWDLNATHLDGDGGSIDRAEASTHAASHRM
jgi:hypothetical protein